MMKDNLEIIYQEISDVFRYQQENINLAYTKLNWILVSNVLIICTIKIDTSSTLVKLFLLISTGVTLFGIQARSFKMTWKLSSQLKHKNESDYLNKLLDKKREAYNANSDRQSNINILVFISAGLTFIAIILYFYPSLNDIFL